jgi:hypothetical protein
MTFEERLRGYTVVCSYDLRGGAGRVQEWDSAGKVRWEITGVRYPMAAQVLPGGRVLVCEGSPTYRVTERDLKGTVFWEKAVPGQVLLSAQRLPNGNTFLVTRSQLLEVTRGGKEVLNLSRPGDVLAAHRYRNGEIGLVTTASTYYRLDRSGRSLKSFAVGRVYSTATKVHFLPGGGVVVPQYALNTVVEYDANGKSVWEASATRVSVVTRLPNGHTLLGSYLSSRLGSRVWEIDKAGTEVWSRAIGGRVLFVDRR